MLIRLAESILLRASKWKCATHLKVRSLERLHHRDTMIDTLDLILRIPLRLLCWIIHCRRTAIWRDSLRMSTLLLTSLTSDVLQSV